MILRSLIIANLCEADFIRFHKARISYFGSTGHLASEDMNMYHEYGSYIATSTDELIHVLDALKWKEMSMEVCGDRLIISRKEK